MANLFTKIVKTLFGIGTKQKTETEKRTAKKSSCRNHKKNENKKRPAPDKSKKQFHQGQDGASEKRKNKKSAADRAGASVQNSAPLSIPPLPDALNEVAPAEGKLRFLDLELHTLVQFGIQRAGFEYCTPIQHIALPALLAGRDLAGKAQTGTGKTAAFLLASFTKLLKEPLEEKRRNGQPRMVVMAPTRELAMQIHKDACQLGVFTGLNQVVVFGGMDHEAQRRALDCQLDVLIGTPGRIIDYSRGRTLDLSKVEILVIDEADRMLDMGFIPDVRRIVSQMPEKGKRQTLLFSATLEESILNLASGWLADPVVYESEPEQMVSDNIDQLFYSVLREDKLALLLNILRSSEYERVIIFGNRKDVNLRLQYDLASYGYKVPVLSGDISQDRRIKILERFRSGKERIVIATDVAARGIHVDDVSIVINYDLPEQPEDYIHRIGRTGRAGNKGVSISFLCEYGAYYLPAIEELLGVTFNSILPEDEQLKLPEKVKNDMPLPEKNHRPGGRGSRGAHSGANRRRKF